MSVVHLNRYQDREESEAHCTGRYEYPSTLDPAEATCVPCLWAAVAAGQRLAQESRARIVAITPTNPGEIERLVEKVKEASRHAGSRPSDSGYQWEQEAVDELLRYLGVEQPE